MNRSIQATPPIFRLIPLFATLLVPAVGAQTAPTGGADVTTLKVNSRIVVLDITVTDKQGRLVNALTRDDFTVLEDKVPQPVRSFESPVAHAMPGSAHGQPVSLVHSAADLPKIGASPVTILVLDELNTRFEDMSYGRNQLIKYLQAQGPVLAQPTALLYATNTRFVQLRDYTQDRDVLLNDVKKHMPEYPSKLMTGTQGAGAVERMAQTLSSLEQLSQASEGTPGRKNVIWVGVGFPSSDLVGLDPTTAATIESAVRRCTDMLLAARITLYTINPTTNTTTTLDVSTPDDLDNAEDESGGQPFAGMIQFSNFAPATGGRAFLSRNDIHNEIAEGIAAGADYYTLSYAPTNASEDAARYRNIRVVMKDPSLHATTRNGYFPAVSAAIATASEPPKQERAQLQLDLSSAVNSTMSYNTLKVSARKVATAAGAATYAITVGEGNPATAITWRVAPDGQTALAEATVLAAWYGSQNKLLGHVAQELTATRPAVSEEEAGFELSVPLGATKPTRLRLVVRDPINGHMGTVDISNP